MPEHRIADTESSFSQTQDNSLLQTPHTLEGIKGSLATGEQREKAGRQVNLHNQVLSLPHVLPTPTTRDGRDSLNPYERDGKLATDTISRAFSVNKHIIDLDWGKFELAIRRWEQVLDRPAPEPTKPDGRDDAHRLSSKFTEWMMGLPEGWITDCGLSRNEELKACGNGVVPQQAELALRLLVNTDEGESF